MFCNFFSLVGVDRNQWNGYQNISSVDPNQCNCTPLTRTSHLIVIKMTDCTNLWTITTNATNRQTHLVPMIWKVPIHSRSHTNNDSTNKSIKLDFEIDRINLLKKLYKPPNINPFYIYYTHSTYILHITWLMLLLVPDGLILLIDSDTNKHTLHYRSITFSVW